jgi:hypothetical protein
VVSHQQEHVSPESNPLPPQLINEQMAEAPGPMPTMLPPVTKEIVAEKSMHLPELSKKSALGPESRPSMILLERSIVEDVSIASYSVNQEESTVIEKEFTSESVADTVSWDFLKKIEQDRKQRRKAAIIFDNDPDPSDTTIMEALFKLTKILRYGKTGEKCEASKKIVYLYQTFKQDFPYHTIFDLFIKAHLDVIKDESWKVRTQVCYSLKGNVLRSRYLILLEINEPV